VQSVEKIERQCNDDQADEDGQIQHICHGYRLVSQYSELVDHNGIYLVGDVLKAIDHLFKMIVKL
jgi:hypothetical protein